MNGPLSDELFVSLGVIAKISKDMKMQTCQRTMPALSDQSKWWWFLESFKRRFFTGDSRERTAEFINEQALKTIELSGLYAKLITSDSRALESTRDEITKKTIQTEMNKSIQALMQLTKSMREAIPGIQNLEETYKDDSVCQKISVYRLKLDKQIKENDALLLTISVVASTPPPKPTTTEPPALPKTPKAPQLTATSPPEALELAANFVDGEN